MSVINQMLRELDARGGTTAAASGVPGVTVKEKRAWILPALAGLGLLAAGAAAVYWMLAAPTQIGTPDTAVMTQADLPVAPVSGVPDTQAAADVPAPPAPVSPALSTEPAGATLVTPSLALPAPEKARASQGPPSQPLALVQTVELSVRRTEPAVVKKVVELSPEVEAQQYVDEAQTLRRSGRLDAAIGKYRLALERNPGMTSARIQLAKLLQESGQADAALSLLKTGYEQRAEDGLAVAAGRLMADLGQRDEALEWLARGQTGLRPADHALIGALLSQAQRHEEAARAYQRALAADPSQGGWLLGLGLALEAQGRVEEARVAYRNALERGQFKPEVVRFLRERSGI